MKRRKKKQAWVVFGVVIFVLIIVIAFIIIRNLTTYSTGQLSVNYEASKNIKATITGTYKKSNGAEQVLSTADGTNKIVFNTEDNEGIEKQSFNKVDNIKLKREEYFLVHYKIVNNNEYHTLVCNLETDIKQSSNIIVEYSINKYNWSENIAQTIGVNGRSIANLQTLNLFVRISVDVKTENAKFDGSFNFVLTTLE